MCFGFKKKNKENCLPGNDMVPLQNVSFTLCFCQDHLNAVAATVGNLPHLEINKTTTPPC